MEALLFPGLRRPGKRSSSIGGKWLRDDEKIVSIILYFFISSIVINWVYFNLTFNHVFVDFILISRELTVQFFSLFLEI